MLSRPQTVAPDFEREFRSRQPGMTDGDSAGRESLVIDTVMWRDVTERLPRFECYLAPV